MSSTSQERPIPSKIKSIYLELPDYSFNHSATEGNQKYYVGRHQSHRRLKMILLNSHDCECGTYLVAGYRGMGKTSLVNQVIQEINTEAMRGVVKDGSESSLERPIKHKIPGPVFWPISISLSQDDVKDIDVLKLMANQLAQEWFHHIEKVSGQKQLNGLCAFDKECANSITARIQALSDNLNAIVKVQVGGKFKTNSQEQQFDRRETIRSEFLPKEVERELIYILSLIADLREKFKAEKKGNIPQFIFVLDELDKIEPNYFYDNDYRSNSSSTQQEQDNIFGANKVRRRQEVVSRLLANLKSFLNIAKAKFIFIGGREMYDASLADIADRDSFYSSIFHDIIYVNSFFKDKVSAAQSGITRLTEAFLCKLIIPDHFLEQFHGEDEENFDHHYNLNTYYQYLVKRFIGEKKGEQLPAWEPNYAFVELDIEEKYQAIYKIIFFLQNFVIYLAYRSNGTPKKLVAMVESFIIHKTNQEIVKKAANNDHIFITTQALTDKGMPRQRLFLLFSFKKQYEVGLTSNIYRPYIIIHSRYLKTLGDKLLYSTSYIMDYLLKFHPHAFSWRNLELIPEIILLNKDPNLRYFISDILNFLSGMYIRETTSGMFQYKFYNKPANEIKLLTKISEPASAAFNFTLDESLHIIRYYRRKLHQLKKTYPNFHEEYIHSIGFIESLLGDLYYLDKEYDEAVVHYTNAIQVLRSMVQRNPQHMTKHQVVLYVKDKLHLGLCLEKMKAFDSAYSIYRSLILNVPVLLEKVMNYSFTEEAFKEVLHEHGQQDEWDKPIRRVQLFIKPHIALLDLIEKQRMDGITYANLSRNHSEVFQFLVDVKASAPHNTITIGRGITPNPSRVKMDTLRVAVLLSDYFSNVGSFLFFKNKNFAELHSLLNELELTSDKTANLYKFVLDRKGHGEYHPSLSGFTYYYLALTKLVESYESSLQEIDKLGRLKPSIKGRKPNAIVMANYLLSESCQGIVSNSILVTFGNLLTRIGDSLLACLTEKSFQDYRSKVEGIELKIEGNKLRVEVLDLFSLDEFNELQSKNQANILKKIFELLENKPDNQLCTLGFFCDINAVLVMYRLAGLFYFKAGRVYSYAFQYKKFLFVLKDYLTCMKRSESILGSTKRQVILKEENRKTLKGRDKTVVIKEACEKAAERIFNANTWLTQVANRPQILKYQDMLKLSDKKLSDENLRMIYLNLSTNAEIRETIVLTEEIKLKLTTMFYLENKPEVRSPISPYDLVTNRFSRLHELRFQSEVNYYHLMTNKIHLFLKSPMLWNLDMLGFFRKHPEMGFEQRLSLLRVKLWAAIRAKKAPSQKDFEKILLQEIENTSGNASLHLNLRDLAEIFHSSSLLVLNNEMSKPQNPSEEAFKEAFRPLFLDITCCQDILSDDTRILIRDSIFALFEVIKTHKLFGVSYMASHSFLANVHFKLANWCAIALNHDLILRLSQGENKDANLLSNLMKDTLGEEEIHYLRPNYHNELAIQHYNATLHTHNGGNAYKSINQSMSFLEDDFNDNMYHFSAASERFRIHTGLVNAKLEDLQRKIKYSNVYNYENYVGGGGIGWG